ncbi:MAG: hypothetical protein AB7O90_10005 [Hyphomicrobium sp.]
MTELLEADRIRLHGLLRAAAEPWLESSIEPIIIGWYQYRTQHQASYQFGRLRLQYGARAWSTTDLPGSSRERGLPNYQAELEIRAVALKRAGWDRLSAGLLQTAPPGGRYKEPDIELFLLIENRLGHFGVRCPSSREEAYFLLSYSGLESVPTARKVWFDAWPRQLDPPVFPPAHMLDRPNRQNAAELARHVRWWYQTPLMPRNEATELLGSLLKLLFERLSCLGKAVAIGTSPHRFNDANGDDHWLAALVDGSLWENGAYFMGSAKTLASAPRALHEAMGLLQEVLTCNVRQKLAEYLGNESAMPDTLVLSSDERGHLIALSMSAENGGPVYRVDPESGLPSLVGVAPRLDWRFAECSSEEGTKSDDDTHGYVVQFAALSEWIEGLGSDEEVSFEYPELDQIWSGT